MTRQYDVVVVGARIAGAATAMLLARAGLRVLCIDQSRPGSDTLSTHALMRGGVLQLRRWGLLDDVVAAGTPPVRRTVFHYGDDSVAVTIKPSGGVSALYAPRRTVLDALLVDAAQRAGATVEFGVSAVDLDRDDDGRVTGVVVGNRHRRTHRVARAPLVIGADGRHSFVARAVGAPRATSGTQASSFLYGYWANLPTDGYEWWYRPGMAAGTIPTNAGETCVFVAATPSRLAAAVRAHSATTTFDRLADVVGLGDRMGSANRVGPVRYVRSLPACYLRRPYGPGWALVGDAGHWMDPISTHGMTSALRDAALLSEAVTTSFGDAQLPAALAHYENVRNELSLPMMTATEEIASYSWDLTRLRTLLRSLSSAMTDEVELLAAIGAAA